MADDDLPTKQPAVEERQDKPGKYRLHLSVPKPLSRVNLGMPWYEKLRGEKFDGRVAKFGYKGLSIQTDSYFFADIEKHSYWNTKKSFQLQAGKEWLQYASASKWIATLQDATFASDARMTLVAGAGQGQRQPMDHGMEVRTDPYNNLYLHYRVDSVMSGLSEFMTGRRVREEPWGLSLFQPFGAREFAGSNALVAEEEGFWDVLTRAADYLGYGLPDFEGLYKHFPKVSDPKKNNKFGYGKPYFTSFDPYEWKKTEGEPFSVQMFLHIKNACTYMRRTADVTAKIAVAIHNMPLVRQAAKLMEAVDKFNGAVDASQRIANAFGNAKPSNSDKVMFGEEAPFDQQMLDAFYPVVDTCLNVTKPKKEDVADVELVAPKNTAKKKNPDDPDPPPYIWTSVPAGIYGYVKVKPDPEYVKEPDPDKMYTFKVPGRTPEVKAKNKPKAISASPTTLVTVTLATQPDPATVTLTGNVVDDLNAAACIKGASAFRTIPGPTSGSHVLQFDPKAIFRFKQLRITEVTPGAIARLGLTDDVSYRFTSAGTGKEVLRADQLVGAQVRLELELRDAPLAVTVAWTAYDTSSAGTAVGAINREAKSAGLPSHLMLAELSEGKIKLVAPEGYLVELSGADEELGFGDGAGPAAEVTASKEPELHWGAARWVAVATEKGGGLVVLTPALLPAPTSAGGSSSLAALVSAINGALGSAGTALDEGGKLKVKSKGYGSKAFAEVRADSVITLVDYLGFDTPSGGASVRQAGEDVSLLPSQVVDIIKGKLGDPVGDDKPPVDPGAVKIEADDAKGTVKLVSKKSIANEPGDYLYYLKVAGELFDTLKPKKSKNYVPKPSWNDEVDAFQKMLSGLNSLPSDLANVVRPITNMVQEIVDLANDASKTLAAIVEATLGSRFVPDGPPSSLGLFAKDGITLGTTDRIVATAGKGYVLFADGGTGQRDTDKFALAAYERVVTNLAANEIKGFGDLLTGPKEDTDAKKEKSGSGGFILFSNSNTSLVTRSSLDLLAIGSHKDKSGKHVGRGVARLAATRSVEVAGHSRVTIAATASEEEEVAVKAERVAVKKDGEELEMGTIGGGEVELLGEQIRLGAPVVHRAHMPMTNETPWPWPKANAEAYAELKDKNYAIPTAERAYAPPTKQVTLGATERIAACSTPFLLQVKHDGIFLGSPGGPEAKKFEDRLKAEKELVENHFKEQKLYWETIVSTAEEAKAKAGANAEKLSAVTKYGDKIEGLGPKDWKQLKDYYKDLGKRAKENCKKAKNAATAAEAELQAKYDALGDHGPALVLEKDHIVLGFQLASGGWGPHLKIQMDGITLTMATKDETERAVIELKEKSIKLMPKVGGDVKVELGEQQAKIESGSSAHITWSSSSVDGTRVKKI